MRRMIALMGCLGLVGLAGTLRAAAQSPNSQVDRGTRPVIAITDFPGDDKALGAFFADTVLTDLGHSDRMQILERTELHQALSDLDMKSGVPLTPAEVRHLGDLLHASRFVVGSYLVRDDVVVINVRMLDSQTGLNVPGSAFTVSGTKRALVSIAHKASHQLCRKLTGEDIVLDEDGAEPAAAVISDVKEPEPAPAQPVQQEIDELDAGRKLGLIPQGVRPTTPLAEHDLAGFIGKLSKKVDTDSTIRLGVTGAPVTRMQALTAVVKLLVGSGDMASFRTASTTPLTPDAAMVPLWGQPFLAAAIDQGWWDSAAPLRPRQPATWGFMQGLLVKLPIHVPVMRPVETARPAPHREVVITSLEQVTGLVIDARDFTLKRDHSPRIVDQDGNEVYPDPGHCPSPDWVEEHGMASYATQDGEFPRSGAHPLVIHAVGTTGPGPFDVVVSNEDAKRILEANRRTKFLWKWNITLLLNEQ